MPAWYQTMMQGFGENRDLKEVYRVMNEFMTQTLAGYYKQVLTMKKDGDTSQIIQGIQQATTQVATYLSTVVSKIEAAANQQSPNAPEQYAGTIPSYHLAKELIEVLKIPPKEKDPQTIAKELQGFTQRMRMAEQKAAQLQQQNHRQQYQPDPKLLEVVKKYQNEPVAIQALSDIYGPQIVQTILQNINVNP